MSASRQAGVLAGRCGDGVQLALGGVPVLDQGVDLPVQRQDAVADQQARAGLAVTGLLEPDECICVSAMVS